MSDIQAYIRQLTGQNVSDQVNIITCTVESVNENERTCVCSSIDNGAETEMPGVQLMSEVSDGIFIIPSVGSTILVAYSRYSLPFVCLFSDVDKIILLGGEHGGLVRIKDLVNKLNKLENDINDLKQIFSSWIPVPNDGGAALKTGISTWYSQELILTDRKDIENTNITHGS